MSDFKIGINGFGRIGRLVLRAALRWKGKIMVSALNDPFIPLDQMVYLFKFDSTHGHYKGHVGVEGDMLLIDGQTIAVHNLMDPKDIPWKDSQARYVIETTGVFTSQEKASGHLEETAGAYRIVVAAPSSDAKILVMGVNQQDYSPQDKIISIASCTANCLAPVAKLIHDQYTIEECVMTTMLAATATLKPLDGPNFKNWRDGRGAFHNIIPTSTGAAKAIGKVIKSLDDKISCVEFRVPIEVVSTVVLTIKLAKATSISEVTAYIKEKSTSNQLEGILGYTDEEVVSSDFIGDSHSCVIDGKASMQISENTIKVVGWYDNETAYASRAIDMIFYMHKRDDAHEKRKLQEEEEAAHKKKKKHEGESHETS